MAYQENFLDEQKDQNTPAGEQVLSSANSGGQGTPGGQAASNATGSNDKGSGFTNLSQYVNANKDQSKQMADTVSANARKDMAAADVAKASASSQFSDLAKQNTQTENKDLVNDLRANPESANSAKWSDIYKQQSAGYKGPADITSQTPYQDLSKRFGALDTTVKGLQNPLTVGQNLQTAYGDKGNYTKGQNTLDSFLTTSGAGADALNSLQSDYKNANYAGQLQNLKTQGQSGLNEAQRVSDQTKASVDSALKSGQDKQAADRLARLNAEAEATAKTLAAKTTSAPAKETPKKLADIKKFTPIDSPAQESGPINIAPLKAAARQENLNPNMNYGAPINIAPVTRSKADTAALRKQLAKDDLENQYNWIGG